MSNQSNVTSGTSASKKKNIANVQNNTSSIQLSRFPDWSLVVEGGTDKKFYKKYTSLQENCILRVLSIEKNEPQLVNNKADGNKEKIICIIREKLKDGKNFFGIIDKDYASPDLKKLAQIMNADEDELIQLCADNNITITDANSLETMMIKYSGTKEFANILKNINNDSCPDFSLIEQDDVENALKYSFYIGLLRKFNEQGNGKNRSLNFLDTCINSHFYYDFINQSFSKEDYISSLIKYSRKKSKLQSKLMNVLSNHQYSTEEAWDINQGHDIFDFIEAILLNKKFITDSSFKDVIDDYLEKRKKENLDSYVPTKFEKKIIDEYTKTDLNNKQFFYKSKIYKWLQQIEDYKKMMKNVDNQIIQHHLQKKYLSVFIILIQVPIRYNKVFHKKAAYIFFGITTKKQTEILDIKIEKNIIQKELNSEDCFKWFENLTKRGIEEIGSICVDDKIDQTLYDKINEAYNSLFQRFNYEFYKTTPIDSFISTYKKNKKIIYENIYIFYEVISKTMKDLEKNKEWLTPVEIKFEIKKKKNNEQSSSVEEVIEK